MKKLTRIICTIVATIGLFAMGGCNKGSMQESEYCLQIGNNEFEYENQDCATVNFMITDNNAISNEIPNGSSLDGFKPCRVDSENPNRIISDWTDVKDGTIPFTGTASDGLTLYPIWSDCTVYSDRTPIGYWEGLDTSSTPKDWTNLQPDEWTDYENKPKYYKYRLEGSSCTADKSFGVKEGTMEHAKAKVDAGFEFMQKLGIEYFCFHDVDIVPEADDIKETNRRLDEISDYIVEKMQKTGIKCLWGTANMFSNPRFMNGAGSTNSADVFAFAAAQTKKALDLTVKFGGKGYVFWGGREGYETLLNTDVKFEQENIARLMKMAVEYGRKIGFKGSALAQVRKISFFLES